MDKWLIYCSPFCLVCCTLEVQKCNRRTCLWKSSTKCNLTWPQSHRPRERSVLYTHTHTLTNHIKPSSTKGKCVFIVLLFHLFFCLVCLWCLTSLHGYLNRRCHWWVPSQCQYLQERAVTPLLLFLFFSLCCILLKCYLNSTGQQKF